MRQFLFIYVFLLIISQLYAQIGGSATYRFLDLPYSANVSALGGKAYAGKDNFSFITQNPALLDKSFDKFLSFDFNIFVAGIKWNSLIFALDKGKYGTFAFGVNYLTYGKFTQTDQNGNILGEFKAKDLNFNLLWSINLDTSVKFGINLKPVYSHYYNYYSLGLALDLALDFYSKDSLTDFSIIFRNIGWQIKPYVKGNKEHLPFNIALGFSTKLKHSPFTFFISYDYLNKFDLTYQKPDNQITTELDQTQNKKDIFDYGDMFLRHFTFGANIKPSEKFYFSVGWNYRRFKEMQITDVFNSAGFSGGITIKLTKFYISYGFSKFFVGANTHSFSLVLKLNSFKKT